MKLGRLSARLASEKSEKAQNYMVFVSIALVALGATLTIVMTSSIHFDPISDFYPQLDLNSVEATSKAATKDNDSATVIINEQDSSNRSYANSVFGIKLDYPTVWSAFELNSRFRDNVTFAVALLRAPFDNASDKYAERVNINTQVFDSKNVTLDSYTNAILNSYANTSGVKIIESSNTTLAGQPAHKVVLADDRVDPLKLKKIQVWSVINNSKAYVVTFGSEESEYQNYLPQFQDILDSLKITGSSDNPEEVKELSFDDADYGINLQYPSSWAKIQLAKLPRANADLIVAFLHQENRNASMSRIGVATQQLISPEVKLEQYTTNQLEAIQRENATGIQDEQTKIADNQAHSAVFNLNGTKVMQIWTLKGDKAYLFTYQASPDDYPKELATFKKMANSLEFKE